MAQGEGPEFKPHSRHRKKENKTKLKQSRGIAGFI
jgi:hypothetical protein